MTTERKRLGQEGEEGRMLCLKEEELGRGISASASWYGPGTKEMIGKENGVDPVHAMS